MFEGTDVLTVMVRCKDMADLPDANMPDVNTSAELRQVAGDREKFNEVVWVQPGRVFDEKDGAALYLAQARIDLSGGAQIIGFLSYHGNMVVDHEAPDLAGNVGCERNNSVAIASAHEV